MNQSTCKLLSSRGDFSSGRLDELRRHLKNEPALKAYSGLTIYAAGSFARGEASKYSDIDLFFLHNDLTVQVSEPRLKGIRVLSTVIRQIEEDMEFPAPSNDGQFMNIIKLSEMKKTLGGAEDDYNNHFTARILLLLESAPVYGSSSYAQSISALIDSYFRDYENHASDFRPTFLVNDILRFWKTLCLNYEHRRNQEDEARKIKQKIKNFKLKYSRLLTCFATVALLASYNGVKKEEIIKICKMRPLDRLVKLSKRCPATSDPIEKAIVEYAWFLKKTELSTGRLESHFTNRSNRKEAFEHADKFGRFMFEAVRIAAESTGTLRYLVI